MIQYLLITSYMSSLPTDRDVIPATVICSYLCILWCDLNLKLDPNLAQLLKGCLTYIAVFMEFNHNVNHT